MNHTTREINGWCSTQFVGTITTFSLNAPPAVTLIPPLVVTIPTESTLVTSSYVNVPPIETLPLNVAATPTTFPTVIAGVPVRPDALVALVAVVALPSKVVAVATPVTTAPLGNRGAPVDALSTILSVSNSGHYSRIFSTYLCYLALDCPPYKLTVGASAHAQ